MALIGAILYTFIPIISIIMAIVGLVSNQTGNVSGDYGASALLTFVGSIIAIITVPLCIFAWIAFARLDKQNDKGWKIFLLVLGILICVFGTSVYFIGAIPGVFFTLAFALKGKVPEK